MRDISPFLLRFDCAREPLPVLVSSWKDRVGLRGELFSLAGRLIGLLNSLTMLLLIEDLLNMVSMSYSDSKIAKIKFQADSPKGSSWLMLLPLYSFA